jgi:hypothetical protein
MLETAKNIAELNEAISASEKYSHDPLESLIIREERTTAIKTLCPSIDDKINELKSVIEVIKNSNFNPLRSLILQEEAMTAIKILQRSRNMIQTVS